MVRRGSTVRVRQRALQKSRIMALLVSVQSVSGAVRPGVEHFMELSGCEGALPQHENGLFGCLGSERPGPVGRRPLGRVVAQASAGIGSPRAFAARSSLR